MQTKKRFKWAGKFSDQCAGKYRVWWSSGAWTLSYGGVQISRHASSEQAKRKAAKHQKTEPSRIHTQTRHDIAASVVRHSNLSKSPLATVEQSRPVDPDTISALAGYKTTISQFAKTWRALYSKLSGLDDRAADLTLLEQIFTNVSEAISRLDLDLPQEDRDAQALASAGPLLIKFYALEYEHARDADPDPRDDEDQEIEGLILMASATLAEECARSEENPILSARGRDKDEDRTVFAREAAQ